MKISVGRYVIVMNGMRENRNQMFMCRVFFTFYIHHSPRIILLIHGRNFESRGVKLCRLRHIPRNNPEGAFGFRGFDLSLKPFNDMRLIRFSFFLLSKKKGERMANAKWERWIRRERKFQNEKRKSLLERD